MNEKNQSSNVNINIKPDSNPEIKDSDVLTSEEALAKITTTMADPKKIELMTQVTDYELRLISALQTIAKESQIPILNTFINYLLDLKVSQERQGRKEIIELTRNQKMSEDTSRIRNMLGKVGLFR